MAAAAMASQARPSKTESYVDNKRKEDIRQANIISARAVADAVRTSLGPKGMDKMISTATGEVIITNDGATILNRMEVIQPAAKMLVELSKSQDAAAGDGTTTVVVIAGALLKQCLSLLSHGIHPTVISDSLHKASQKAVDVLTAMAIPVELSDRDSLIKSASTSLNSKVVSQYSTLLAPLAVDAVLSVVDPAKPDLVDLRDIKIVKKLGGTVDDTELVRGLVFDKKASHAAGGPTRVENAKIGVIQFQISPPKTDIEQSIVVSDYTQMDRILKEERNYILGIIKKIRATGCNVLLIQKSILRDAVTDLSLHYLAKAKIMVIKDVERDEIEFITKTLNCLPIANIEHFRAEKLGHADLVEEVSLGDSKILKIMGIKGYAAQIKKCGEMARKLRYFKDQMSKAGLSPPAKPVTRPNIDMDELEVKLGELEAELIEINANNNKLQRSHNELGEYMLVLRKAGEFFASAQRSAATQQKEMEQNQGVEESIETPLLQEEKSTDPSKQVKLGFISGLVPREKSMAFERILFRATRGNVFLKQAIVDEPVIDPLSGEKVEKNVFVVFYSGEKAKNKILKICEAFGANKYPFSEDFGRQVQMITEVSGRLTELKTTIDVGLLHWNNLLKNIADQYEQWSLMVRKEKSVYHTLNMLSFDVTKKCLVAEGWSPVFASKQIQEALERAAIDSNSQVGSIFQVLRTKESPPTYFCTNKFTSAFQEIVDAYGVAKYQEANPGVFTIVTFPFLFAVMFGDWGHGICLLLATLYFIVREKKLSSQKLGDITEMTFGGRYVILMMALFSIYTGLIYNEFFSVPFELFAKSAYTCRDLSCRDATTIGLIKTRDTYPFGVDPAWHGTRSELPFLNSLKMKMSILLGVAQMNLGIILSYFNATFFRNNLNIWFQFIPQIIFLNGLFGYLSVLIIIKWWTGSQADLYHVMIYMFLSPTDDLGENQLFPGQKTVQLVLLLLALVSVPWMLLPKPLLLKKQHQERHQGQSYMPIEGTEDSLQAEGNHDSHDHEEFEFSEVFVHQLIHTIEFVLGAVSNTASYLRLWALSLAHSELSSVFYEKVLLLAWGFNNVIILIVGIIVFIFATVGVLLVMETLSAFLHALRLHWVEFQNKFYEGDGYKFYPFSFELLNGEED